MAILNFSNIGRMNLVYSVAGGILLFLSFPHHGRGYVAWIALVPLFASLHRRNPADSFLLGFLFGFVAHVGILYWISYVVVVYGSLPVIAGIAAMFLLCAYLALYIGIFSALLSFARERGIALLLAAPPLWISMEWIKGWMLTGFPWGNFAYSQYQNVSLIQIADVTGIHGITFLLVTVNALLFDILIAKGELKKVAGECVICCMLLVCFYVYGILRIDQIARAVRSASPFGVNLVQGNIDQNVKWNPDDQSKTVDIYHQLSLKEAHSGAALIVWPETAAPFYLQDASELQKKVIETAVQTRSWLIVGSPSYDRAGNHVSYRNSAFLLSPDGEIQGRYDKVHLVPYGEYVPLRTLFPFLSKMVVGIGDFQGGKEFLPLVLMAGKRAGTLICYEAIFPEYSRCYKRQGAELLVNITNDAWFGETSAPYQHLSMAVFRAVENRVYFIRAANTGISAIIDPTGRISARTILFERTVLKGTARWMRTDSIYARHGDIFLYLCLTWMVAVFIIAAARKGGDGV